MAVVYVDESYIHEIVDCDGALNVELKREFFEESSCSEHFKVIPSADGVLIAKMEDKYVPLMKAVFSAQEDVNPPDEDFAFASFVLNVYKTVDSMGNNVKLFIIHPISHFTTKLVFAMVCGT